MGLYRLPAASSPSTTLRPSRPRRRWNGNVIPLRRPGPAGTIDDEGLVVAGEVYYDQLGLLMQLGHIPDMSE